METRLLIDAVVRQTTLLIAQLATSTGIRAPLSHLADQVFLELAQEIEQQGVSRKVAADMFGLALRSYQRKVGRLRESATVGTQTLWQAVLEHIKSQGTVTRSQLLRAFVRDDENDVAAVLSDLVSSGLVYSTGRGQRAVYGVTTHSAQQALLEERASDTLLHLVWLALAMPAGVTRAELIERFPEQAAAVDAALAKLVEDGRARAEQPEGQPERFRSANVLIPIGSEAGWESAVLDHFAAVCTALASKLRQGGAAHAHSALVGGTTLSFELGPDHPYEHEVKGLLTKVRDESLALWRRVAAHNAAQPPPEEQLSRVVFYVGQNFIPCDSPSEELP
ncbi:MAG TPA: hypothetical protein VFZ61_13890 [Polyangiales bacterium]